MGAKEIAKNYDPKNVEDRWYRFWEEKKLFAAKPKRSKKPYSIVIPPPNITGILHMGHALNNTIQDVLIRWRRMQGREALWMPGTDHAGIATQNVVERKIYGKGTRKEDLGRDLFLREVWKWKEEYGSTIIKQLKKLGCSCDWDRTRFTMDEVSSDAVLETFIRLHKKGLIYRGNYIINWCPRCKTALSDEEAQHKEIDGMLYHVKYPINGENGYVVVATTRPETMLGDTGLAVNPKDKRFKHLKGKTVKLPLVNRELKVIFDPVVDMKFGTGALKITPAHDPVDFQLGVKHKLESINVMNEDATINSGGGEFAGMDRFEAREAILVALKEKGLLVKSELHRHAVGHCYRCHTMVEPRLSKQWFVSMKPLAKPAIAAVKAGKIKFVPKRWTKVYLEWMTNIRDWCISRQIWWGHRIPVYYCMDCQEQSPAAGRRSPEKKKKGKKAKAEKGIIVARKAPKKCPDCGGGRFVQDTDVLDTWFSSWLWPFSTFGWPFGVQGAKEKAESKKALKYFYPTDTLVTAQEIIFFWVARMIMAGYEFIGDLPFANVYIHGTVRDDTGTKMSKSLGNVIDPLEIIGKFGADALRFSLLFITGQGTDVYLNERKFEVGRNFANKIWNASRFMIMNMNRDQVNGCLCELNTTAKLELPDRWILSRFYRTLKAVTKSLEEYNFNEAESVMYEFFWHNFCDWYLEISKHSINSKKTQMIVYKILEKSLRVLHPFMPFVTEEIWQNLPHDGDSIMTQAWPGIQASLISKSAEEKMALVIDIITSIRNLRSLWNIPPARSVHVSLKTHDVNAEKVIRKNSDYIRWLAKIDLMDVGDVRRVKESAISVLKNVEIYLPLSDIVDVEQEKDRMRKHMEQLKQNIRRVSSVLRDKAFLKKAPEAVVESQRERLNELQEKHNRISENIEGLE
ncbi:MAG: valine--tRNA ligase [Candidatus Omnitrophota bacterium]